MFLFDEGANKFDIAQALAEYQMYFKCISALITP